MLNNNYLSELNPSQREAVEYVGGPALVIAGAGSGKTRVLTYKIVHLLHSGYEPWQIMALTFTNKAAREMRGRIEKMAGTNVAGGLWMGTFHSIFGRLLRIYADKVGFKQSFTIYDTGDSKSLVKMLVKELGLDDKQYNPSKVLRRISDMKNKLVSPEEYAADKALVEHDERQSRPLTHVIYRLYCERCRVAEAMDFDDLLVHTHRLLTEHHDVLEQCQQRFRYFLVDEYQDTNYVQHRIMELLAGKSGMLTVVGDDAQSIYAFRGARISNILNMSTEFPSLKVIKLERNYRSTQNIIDAANSLIAKNTMQISKTCYTENEAGDKVLVVGCHDDKEESYYVSSLITSLKSREGSSFRDFAVLYRTNSQSRRLEEALSSGGLKNTHGSKRRGIPYRVYGGQSFYDRKEVKDAIAYFRLSVNPDDDEALRRVLNYPARGIGQTTEGKLRACAVANGTSMWHVVSNAENYELKLNKGTLNKISSFAALVKGFIKLNDAGTNAQELAEKIIERSNLIGVLLGDRTPENESKKENLYQLIGAAKDYVEGELEQGSDRTGMFHFLQMAQLSTDQDEERNNHGDCVTLMTVHAAKGLEFNNVIITGLEEDLFPSALSTGSLEGIEEERRLMYVAITRAKKHCIITHAKERFRNGTTTYCNPSRFLSDLDPRYLEIKGSIRSERFVRGYSTPAPQREYDATPVPWGMRHDTPVKKPIRHFAAPSTPAALPPNFKRYSPDAKPAQQFASDGEFTTHTVQEIVVGMKLMHNRFGKGVVTAIDTSGADAKISVKFDGGTKTLLLKFAKFLIIR